MARTLAGNLTGRAAQTARREFAEAIYSSGSSTSDRLDCGDAMIELRKLDPAGWEKWYDENVTDGSFRHITKQVLARIAELTADWFDDYKTPAQDDDYQDLHNTQESARL